MLAAIDWNNSSRQQEHDDKGQRKMRMCYTTRGREFVLRKVYNYKKMKTEQKYFYYILFTIQSGSFHTHHLSLGTSTGLCARHAGIALRLRVTVYWQNDAYRYDLEQVRLTCRLKCPHCGSYFFLLCSDYNMMHR